MDAEETMDAEDTMDAEGQMDDTIRSVLAQVGKMTGDLGSLDRTDDLYQRGLTSAATVNVMLALEDAFDVEFPDEVMKKTTIANLGAVLSGLVAA